MGSVSSFPQEMKEGPLASMGNYRITKQIGLGSFASVYLASHPITSVQVALKVTKKSDIDAYQSLLVGKRALEIISKHNDPAKEHIVKMFEYFEREGRACLVVEYLAGGELFDYMLEMGSKDIDGKVGIPIETTRQIMSDLLKAVSFLHSIGISHGDIKLENVLLKNKTRTQITLIDFGMAEFIEPRPALEMKEKIARGSPLYLSPEAILSLPRDAFKSDVWACGIILFALLTLRMPFDGDSPVVVEGQAEEVRASRTLARKIATGRFEWTKAEIESVPEDAREFVGLMLCRDPDYRLTANELVSHPWLKTG